MDDRNVMSASEMISRVFSNITRNDIENGNKVISTWRKTVESINPNGPNIAAHSTVVDLKNGVLLIEADHPGWIQLLQMHKKYILTGLNRNIKELKIDTLAFRLKGSNFQLSDEQTKLNEEKERERMQRKLDDESKVLDEKGYGYKPVHNTEKKELPDELKKIFERFKKEMENSN